MYDVHNPPMMKCGHAANSTKADGSPACVICAGIVPGADEIVEQAPDLAGREASCTYCGSRIPSSQKAAFFSHRPDRPTDSFYCGCRGWD